MCDCDALVAAKKRSGAWEFITAPAQGEIRTNCWPCLALSYVTPLLRLLSDAIGPAGKL